MSGNQRMVVYGLSAISLAVAVPGVVDKAFPASIRCTEDMTCWSWSTMGNLTRGVYANDRTARLVVEPCKFSKLVKAKRIDWKRTRKLKGDTFAKRHGCDPKYYALSPKDMP